jgi:hypothetical protein
VPVRVRALRACSLAHRTDCQVEISSMDIADALAQMAEKHRYREARARACCLFFAPPRASAVRLAHA